MRVLLKAKDDAEVLKPAGFGPERRELDLEGMECTV
jgi:hypothetical protein